MKFFIAFIAFVAFASVAFADTTQSRDGDGQKMQGGAFGAIRSKSVGTKGFACFSTLNRIAWNVKVAATISTDGSGLGFKMFYNGNESITFPISDSFAQYQNAPVSKSPTISSVCLRAYSSATAKTASGLFQ